MTATEPRERASADDEPLSPTAELELAAYRAGAAHRKPKKPFPDEGWGSASWTGPTLVSREVMRGTQAAYSETLTSDWEFRDGKGFAAVYRLTIPETPDTGDGCFEGEEETPDKHAETPDKHAQTPDTGVTPPLLPSLPTSLRGDFSQLRKKNLPRDLPEDALKRRCMNIFIAKGVKRDDCVRAIDRLRVEGIGDDVIDIALGQCEKKPEVRHVGYLLKVARDWYAQRTGGAP